MTALAWGTLASPVGELSVACSAAGVARIGFGPAADRSSPAAGAAADVLLARTRRQLTAYFRGERTEFSVPVDWSALSGARRQVLSTLLATVGYGQTITYGALAARTHAARAGAAGAGPAGSAAGPAPTRPEAIPARVVGQIMGSNPVPLIVPCHRVVAREGLGGYSGGAGVEVKRWLLVFEGAIPATLDWDPAGLA